MTRRHPDSTTRFAWIATLVAPLLLAVVLLSAQTASAAQASTAGPGQVHFSFDEEAEEEREEAEEEALEEELGGFDDDYADDGSGEDELGGSDCELAHEGLEEGLLTQTDVEDLCEAEEEWKAAASGGSRSHSSGTSCALRSARAHVATRRNRLRLTIGYTADAPTRARIEIRAGNRRIGSVKRRLGRSGILRITRKLGKKRRGRIMVRFRTPSCNKLQTRFAKVR